ncbi:MAG: vitamin K epoxide reductase family protein [Candidatus Spechtbacterales bacterium]
MKIKINKSYYIYFSLLLLAIVGFSFLPLLPKPAGFYAFVATVGAVGFGIATYIFRTKRSGKELVCPTGSNCNTVVNSRFAKFMGIHLEYLGMLYYGLIFLIYGIMVFFLDYFNTTAIWLVLLFTAGAFLFSCYLLFVQAFLLRQWCIWCLFASMCSMLIFIVSLVSLESLGINIGSFAGVGDLVSSIHSLGFALSLGGTTIASFVFFRSLRDFSLDDREMWSIQSIAEIVWVGLGLALMGQFASYVVNADATLSSPAFILQTLSLLFTAGFAAVLMIIFAPLATAVPFKAGDLEKEKTSVLASLRKPIFVNGALVMASLYFAFFMDYVKGYSLGTLLFAYGVFLALAVIVAMMWQKGVSRGKLV